VTKGKVVAVLAALTGCAGAGSFTMNSADTPAGHWDGSIGRDGWTRPLSLDIEREGETWRGRWTSLQQGPGIALQQLEVRGGEVLFETNTLRFSGRVTGDKLFGTVTDLPAGGPAGEFALTREDPNKYSDE